jgi:hypothetical protein
MGNILRQIILGPFNCLNLPWILLVDGLGFDMHDLLGLVIDMEYSKVNSHRQTLWRWIIWNERLIKMDCYSRWNECDGMASFIFSGGE